MKGIDVSEIPYDNASFQTKYVEIDGELKFMWSVDEENWYPMPEQKLHTQD